MAINEFNFSYLILFLIHFWEILFLSFKKKINNN